MTRGWPLSLLALVACADILGISDYEVTSSSAGGAGAASGPSGGGAAGGGDTGGSETGGGGAGPGGSGGVGPGGGGAGPGGSGGGVGPGSGGSGGTGGASPCTPTNYREAILCDEPLAYLPLDGSLENLGPVGGPGVKSSNFLPIYTLDADAIGGGIVLVVDQGLVLEDDPAGDLQFLDNAPHTVEAWTRAEYGSSGAIASIGTWTGTTGWQVFNFIEPAETYEYKRNEQPHILLCDDCEISESAYNHLVSTYDGSVARIYVNGVIAKTLSIPVPLLLGSLVRVGGPNVGDSSIVFNEVALYDYELSPAQVQLHYNYGSGMIAFPQE